MSEKMNIERTFAAIAQRPSHETARAICTFFSTCLTQRGYQNIQQLNQILEALIPTIDYMLIMHAVEQGFFCLETEDMQITLHASYDVLGTEEDLSVPSLGILGKLSAQSPLHFVISVHANNLIDQNTLSRLEEINRRQKLLRIDVVGPVKESTEPPRDLPAQADLPTQEPVGLLKRVVEGLGLSAGVIANHARALMENTRVWQAEGALVAMTLVFKNLRLILGKVDPQTPIDLEKIRSYLERAGGEEYTVGVFLIPPATPERGWKSDDKGRTYSDIAIGDVPQEQLEKAEHRLLQ